VVTRTEIQEKLWTADTFVDFEHSLNSAIKKLRAVLGDSPENSRYIETVPRLGYRFIAPVEEIAANPQFVGEIPSAPANAAGVGCERDKWRHRRWLALLGVCAVLVMVTASYFVWSRTRARLRPSGGRVMLAVLPFENLTGDSGQDYLSDGLTEEMIAQVGHLDPEHLGVIARTSVMRYKHGQQQLPQIGRELAVQYVLEGSLRRDSGKVRITAQLVQMKDQTPVWSRQYDREPSSLLALQGEIGQEIADEIQLVLGTSHKVLASQVAASPSSYESYDLLLKGPLLLEQENQGRFSAGGRIFSGIDRQRSEVRAGLCLAS